MFILLGCVQVRARVREGETIDVMEKRHNVEEGFFLGKEEESTYIYKLKDKQARENKKTKNKDAQRDEKTRTKGKESTHVAFLLS